MLQVESVSMYPHMLVHTCVLHIQVIDLRCDVLSLNGGEISSLSCNENTPQIFGHSHTDQSSSILDIQYVLVITVTHPVLAASPLCLG